VEGLNNVYKYFISYSHPNGFGRCEITRDTEIKGIDDILGIEKAIRENSNLGIVVIQNYRLF
jgi:hypothetical protein